MQTAVLDKLIGLIAPHYCVVCGQEGSLACLKCQKSLVKAKTPTCFRCNRLTPDGRTCLSCRSSTRLAGVTVASHYSEELKSLISAIKYRGAGNSAHLAAGLIVPKLLAEYDLVTSVPAPAGRLRQRGYNQSKLIAKEAAKQIGLPYSDLLGRIGSGRQVGQARQARLRQVQGVYFPVHTGLIRGSRILIIDDVITTGATLSECAKTLKEAGAKTVWGAAVAKH